YLSECPVGIVQKTAVEMFTGQVQFPAVVDGVGKVINVLPPTDRVDVLPCGDVVVLDGLGNVLHHRVNGKNAVGTVSRNGIASTTDIEVPVIGNAGLRAIYRVVFHAGFTAQVVDELHQRK